MRVINQEELNIILKNHKLWLEREGGKRADLSYVDLSYFDLSNIDLRNANLRYANLELANLRDTNLSNANLRYANLRYADLSYADLELAILTDANLKNADLEETNLKYADLRNANLGGADLSYADLEYADLEYADLEHADLRHSNLICANLKNVRTNFHTVGCKLACPEEGSFIGFKKANECLIKLLILEDAKRSSSTTSKCRCDKAKVLEITDIKTGEKIEKISSNYDSSFVYRTGEIVYVNDFDENRWNECSAGIHFFINKQDAINY